MNVEYDITCPACKRKFKERASNMELGKTRTCPNCGKSVEYTSGDVNKDERDIDNAMSDVKNAFKKSGK